MANFHKFRVTYTGTNAFGVGGAGAFKTGEEIVLTEEQARKWVKTEDLRKGYLEYLGEADTANGPFSENIRAYLDGKPGFKNNILQVAVDELVPATGAAAGTVAVTTEGTELTGGYKLGRRVALESLMYKVATNSGDAVFPSILMTAGSPSLETDVHIVGYDSSEAALADKYTTLVNGSLDATVDGVEAFATGDALIVGAPSQFDSLKVIHTAGNTASTTVSASYWDGSAWVDFTYTTDLTTDGTNTLANSDSRIVWWSETGYEWKVGGPAGSGATSDKYYIRLTFDGALTGLAGGTVYPVLDTPLQVLNAGTGATTSEAVYYNGVADTLTDSSGGAVTIADASDYAYYGVSSSANATLLEVTTTVPAGGGVVEYWNGSDWVTLTEDLTGGAGAWAVTPSPGSVLGTATFAEILANDGITATAPTLTTTGDLYWIRISDTAPALAIAADPTWVKPEGEWINVDPMFSSSNFIDADEPIYAWVGVGEDTIVDLEAKGVFADV